PSVPLSLPLRPPRAPLFPYTTLFRSAAVPLSPGPQPGGHAALVEHEDARGVAPDHAVDAVAGEPGDLFHSGAEGAERAEDPVGEDRKSTRLNSSHDQISYAVFCLKKK